jgi:class 3 adenylate cyclase/tetratricopeptide (TPR) repeat protein
MANWRPLFPLLARFPSKTQKCVATRDLAIALKGSASECPVTHQITCPACGRSNRADAKFCDACGTRLDLTAAYTRERRQITAFFCDIVDYTRLAQALDEEDLQAFVRAYQRDVTSLVARWGGHVESYAGDGVNAYFGYPQAHENDAERAVRAGLEILTTIGSMNLAQTTHSTRSLPPLAVRVGLHSGSVIVGELGTGEHRRQQALGPTLNIAARLQSVAQPGTVTISETTRDLVQGMFRFEDLGTPSLKGIDEPIRAFAVIESTGVRGRVEGVAAPSTPLIGRDRELATLHQYWEQTRRGNGQVVLVSGEAGIGKSKLTRRFTRWVVEEGGGRIFEWRCSPFHTTTPFHPIIESLEHYLVVDRGTPRHRLGPRVSGLFSASGLSFEGESDLAEATDLVVELISPTGPEDEHAVRETPAVRRAALLNTLCNLARAQARSQPSVVIVEDVNWADPSTLELLDRLVTQCRDVPLLLLFTFRPDFVSPWSGATGIHALNLEPLTSSQSAELFDAIVGHREVGSNVRNELVSRSDGIPLFVEELTRSLLDPAIDGSPKTLSAIPNTLRGLLVSRLDRLSPRALETIRMASALSREFRFDLLAGVSWKTPKALREDLRELVQSGLVYQRRALTSETYVFKHALVADAAYDSILRSDRRRLHGQIAHRLGTAFPAVSTDQPELLAFHFGEAGELEAAVEQWSRAGDSAIARGAYREATQHFERGLQLLHQIPSEDFRLQHEVGLTESKGRALFSMLGYAHPDVENTFARASALCEQDGTSPPLRVLYGIWAVHIARNNRQAIEALLPHFAELARSGEPVALMTGLAHAGVYAFFSGDFAQCLAQMTEATKYHATSWYGAGLYPLAYRMWTLVILGRTAEALTAAGELRTLAEQSGDPYGFAIAGGFLINLARDRRDFKETLKLAEQEIAYAQRQMLPFWEGPAHCSRGWARACLGDVTDGLAELRLGLQYLDAVGLRATYPYQLGGLAEALLIAGDPAAARAEAMRGLSMCETGLDRFFEAELIRLGAKADEELGDIVAAESGYMRAVELSLRQSALLFALRAATSLAQLARKQGRGDLGCEPLKAVLGQMSEGIDLADVATARDVLGAIG